MKKILIQFLILVVYSVVIWSALGNLTPVVAPWFSTLMSIIVILAYYLLAIRKYIVPLIVILIVTVIFPLAVLVAVGVPVYGSWSSSVSQLAESMINNFLFWGPQFMPFIASSILASLLIWRSNKAFKKDAA